MKAKRIAAPVLMTAMSWLAATGPALAGGTPRLMSPYLALEPAAPVPAPNTDQRGEASTGRLFNGALLGGAAGLLLGGVAAIAPANSSCKAGEDEGLCAAGWIALGGGLGGALGVPIGVHVANGGRGRLGLSMLASTAIAGLGVLGSVASHSDTAAGVIMLGVVPVSQIFTAIAIERKTSRSHRH
jgi:hypothetical protein